MIKFEFKTRNNILEFPILHNNNTILFICAYKGNPAAYWHRMAFM